MAVLIKMPKLGATMKDGNLANWQVKEGDFVKEGDILFEVETDKLTKEVETDEEGFIRKILVQAGETVACQTPLALLAGEEEDISEFL